MQTFLWWSSLPALAHQGPYSSQTLIAVWTGSRDQGDTVGSTPGHKVRKGGGKMRYTYVYSACICRKKLQTHVLQFVCSPSLNQVKCVRCRFLCMKDCYVLHMCDVHCESRDFVSYVHKQFVQVSTHVRTYLCMTGTHILMYKCLQLCFFLPSKSSHYMFRPNECPSDLSGLRASCLT